MTYYIVDKKANNFSKISDFAITVTIAACNSLRIYILSVFASFVTCLLSVPRLLHLCLLCLSELFALSASFVACSVYVYYLCLIYFVYVYYASVNYLLRLYFLWLALFASAICAPFVLSVFAML